LVQHVPTGEYFIDFGGGNTLTLQMRWLRYFGLRGVLKHDQTINRHGASARATAGSRWRALLK
jgi:hypothetical protein